MSQPNPKDRFTKRAEDYARYRPGYPKEAISFVEEELGSGNAIADLGSGTGILSEIFLRRDYVVFGVEPNSEMRAVAESRLGGDSNFHSVHGSAENTTLAPGSIDIAVAGQAFHWFDPTATRRELIRILRSEAWCLFIWNERMTSSSPFAEAYENFLVRWGTDYERVKKSYEDVNAIQSVVGKAPRQRSFPNQQRLDRGGLRGRLRSVSYVPAESEPGGPEMMRALDDLFSDFSENGSVIVEYRTNVYWEKFTRQPGE